MTFENLANIFLQWGYIVKPAHYERFEHYLNEMLNRHRVLFIFDEKDTIEAVIIFFLTDDYEKLYKKQTWEVPQKSLENEMGKQIYIDKMVCRKWHASLRRDIRAIFQDKFPHAEECHWHRAPNDRHVILFRRRKTCLTQ